LDSWRSPRSASRRLTVNKLHCLSSSDMRAPGTVISLNHLSIMANILSVVRPFFTASFSILVPVERRITKPNLRRNRHVQ
jgi:hypothetical protein